MENTLESARETFIQAISRISHFWGFPKAMGSIYATLYLSPNPLSLDDLVEGVGVTKGAVSTNVRTLERLDMVHKHLRIGDRKDYYTAEVDFWKIIKSILHEREKSEFDTALRTVSNSLEMVRIVQPDLEGSESKLATFYQERIQSMEHFFNTLDNLVAAVLALDEFRLSSIQKLLGENPKKNQKSKSI
jgi:DNA-binding transcriptional regulator GbsR (MarR family)